MMLRPHSAVVLVAITTTLAFAAPNNLLSRSDQDALEASELDFPTLTNESHPHGHKYGKASASHPRGKKRHRGGRNVAAESCTRTSITNCGECVASQGEGFWRGEYQCIFDLTKNECHSDKPERHLGWAKSAEQCVNDAPANDEKLVHLVWWGNPGNQDQKDTVTEGARAMVTNFANKAEVHLWKQGAISVDTDLAGIDGLTTHNIDVNGNTIQTLLQDTGVDGNLHTDINAIIKSFVHYGMYAAVKDLLFLVVLLAKGGRAMDFTVIVDGTMATDLMTHNPGLIKLPQTASMMNKDVFFTEDIWVHTGEEFQAGIHRLASPVPGFQTVPGIDIWMVGAAKRSAVIKSTLEHYVAIAKSASLHQATPINVALAGTGPDLFNAVKNSYYVDGVDDPTSTVDWMLKAKKKRDTKLAEDVDKDKDKKLIRNTFVGQLATASYRWALYELVQSYYKTDTPTAVQTWEYLRTAHLYKMGFDTDEDGEKCPKVVAKVAKGEDIGGSAFGSSYQNNFFGGDHPTGLKKVHKGSWRGN